ncbi:MAG TPA: Holliday junction branch migration protein RuvA [Cryomorphaceae bacterium]|jgi:holliday junction DNA helicase RuvA|nr:MAG: ATP-dependent DNA helicase RuvA [Cryomorphaceae bacterium BACL7 MAG-120910-bin2]KRO69564.1 MAG: ATP-dependent DNA helicase RuvA [Cryomorphaceae bacterium BACL7 MAG-120322-bin74]KRO82655.1 MAG: ATP-dependent DNA helicase RuvA [Cryomorphaceae bacterium BACL7 MAG-121220-bin83]NQW24764.1 Holliday junction branch migration protein RuvA [Cryomorphaceae bacterium]HAB32057.1 Holliday junction branch migration protein RuvA [Cryomorphaceae bacterium]|tara:strand:- start:647 stop:1222 length:576 start_codon:yes stop_codon:yes gene_type:complete
MFHHFVGKLIEKSPAHAILQCGGVGYYFHISLTTYGQLPDAPEVKLLAHAVYREDAQLLFGFATAAERDVFLLLLGVSGVGANTARMILSALQPAEAIQAIASGNSGLLQRIKGIGAKTAQRIVVDLRDKVGKVDASAIGGETGSVRGESIQALVVLGFPRTAVEKSVASIVANTPEATVESVVKQALAQL